MMNLNSDFLNIAARLKEERVAKGLSQDALSAIGEVNKRVQINYEKGATFPDARYFFRIKNIGFDVQYIITGERSTQALSDDEQRLLDLFKKGNLQHKTAIMAVAESGHDAHQGHDARQGTVTGDNNIVGNNNIRVGSVVKGSGNTVNVDMNKKNGKK